VSFIDGNMVFYIRIIEIIGSEILQLILKKSIYGILCSQLCNILCAIMARVSLSTQVRAI
jgi:hypothetical protein